ncbi:Ribonuclease H domain [Arabidopsis thaliana x Arabidopsis arenosa]|uniref:Ribonuclease H domain n=1 Tax=Arabidopsis thaliana x Arabidopsis arenosa TaxID=1240361 RepID=A0A8T1YYJ0_9BRAS|nr:Ribonuclease H domain [Arabidopsis thaliana x Arabidopsis arenosa]
MSILKEYEKVSGQAVNLNKSAITFGSRVKQHVKTRLRRILNIHNDGGCGKYLGLPEQIGRNKKEIFSYVVEKVKQRTKSWSNKFLSEAGKEILLKTIALALPVYTMNVFKLPKGICEEINRILANHWWSKQNNRRAMHWVSWKRLSLPKKEGGLGFRDIENFNLALLGKQVWRILQAPNSLLSRFLKARYFPNTNILNTGPGFKPSFIWRSLLEGRDLLRKGMRLLIGNGQNTNVWSDPWLPTHPPRAPRCLVGTNSDLRYVKDLMNARQTGWNIDTLRLHVVPEDIPLISNVRIFPTPVPDLLGWNYNDTGLYTVKSGYWLATHLPEYANDVDPPPGLLEFKKAIWKMKTAPKLQHFLWRILSNALAAGTTLVYRGITRNSQCTRCHKAEESIEHLFFDCEYVQAIWQSNSVFHSIHPTRSFEEKFRAIIECYNNQNLSDLERQLPIWTLWRIWKSRNQLVYQKKDSHWQEDKIKAEIEAKEWVDCWPTVTSVTTSNSCRLRSTTSAWMKPKEGYVKCNYDCKFFQNGQPSQAAWIFRDSDGFFLHAGHSIGERCSSVLEAEIQALIMALQQAWIKGFTNIIFEGDNNSVTKLVNGETLNFNVHNWIREANFWKNKLPNAEFKWTSRHNNKAADRLAKEHFQGQLRFESFFFVPLWLVNILHEDHSID